MKKSAIVNSPASLDRMLKATRELERSLGINVTSAKWAWRTKNRPEDNGEVKTRLLTPDERKELGLL